jgi:Gas vesicle synthesis protein GvpL/GvpF
MAPAVRPLCLYAVVPGDEAPVLAARRRFSVLACGGTAALFGRSAGGLDPARAAVRHDRIVRLALANCSSVVPFRLGTELASTDELRAVVQLNAADLAEQLARFRGRVEMGLKVRLAAVAGEEALRWPAGLDRVRALAPEASGRRERFGQSPQGKYFEGCYLIERSAVDEFWQAVEGIRDLAPGLPLLGSGPWAPYSFCDAPLRRAAGEPV